jgi:sterol desaturase/sphingolipid hydroxylase (fatty acid hydroxylase superfamily)
VRLGYLVANAAAFGFFFTIESGDGALVASTGRWRHVRRNVAVWLLLLLLTDVIVLGWWLDVPALLTASHGLFTPLHLTPLLQLVIGYLLIDVFLYGFHVAMHRVGWLWSLHAVHHSDRELDASTALRYHPVEAAIQYAVLTGVLLLLGIPLWVEGARALIVIPMVLFQHTNHAFPAAVERLLGKFLITPAAHRLHHSLQVEERNSNYGDTLNVWDRLFGTYRAPQDVMPRKYGLRGCDEERWQTVSGMLLTPLRLFARGLRGRPAT